MPAPIVSWYTADNSTPVTLWDIGTVDAGTVSPSKTVLIWNNRGGSTPVSDMTNCTITTKDQSGGNTGELVTGTWIEAKLDAVTGDPFKAVGGLTTKAIKAVNDSVAVSTIKGDANDGSITADNNFSQVTLRANVPVTATAGLINFLTRVSYQYV